MIYNNYLNLLPEVAWSDSNECNNESISLVFSYWPQGTAPDDYKDKNRYIKNQVAKVFRFIKTTILSFLTHRYLYATELLGTLIAMHLYSFGSFSF